MRLLIVTQIVDQDDPVLGFFHTWVETFAKQVESVEVICLKEGRHALPENVHVHSLGKEHPPRFVARIVYALRFIALIWDLRRRYDTVFVHMNPEYVILGGRLWRLMGKRIGFWYTHKMVDLKLRLAVMCTHVVFTASKESFRLPTKKLHVVGHGIDTAPLRAVPRVPRADTLRVLTIGRFSATKRIKEMLAAVKVLTERDVRCSFTVVGAPATAADAVYKQEIEKMFVGESHTSQVSFVSGVAYATIPTYLAGADVFVNLSKTGSMDKAVLEALIAGVPVVTTNEAFRDLLAPYGLFIETDTPEAIAAALEKAVQVDIRALTDEVSKQFALPDTIGRVVRILAQTQ